MPGMDGFQALDELQSHRDTKDIPVIMISARARPRDREDALFMGAVDYVTKPWSEGEVELRVDWVLNQRSKASDADSDQEDGSQAMSDAISDAISDEGIAVA